MKKLLIFLALLYTNIVYCQFVPINNGESGYAVRTNMNRMFDQIYDNLTSLSFSVNGTTGWHAGYRSNDNYIRYSTDYGATWSTALAINNQLSFQFCESEDNDCADTINNNSRYMKVSADGITYSRPIRLGKYDDLFLEASPDSYRKISIEQVTEGPTDLIIEAGTVALDLEKGGNLKLKGGGGGSAFKGDVIIGSSGTNNPKVKVLDEMQMAGKKITGVNTCVNDSDAVNKKYLREYVASKFDSTYVIGEDTLEIPKPDTFYVAWENEWKHSGDIIEAPDSAIYMMEDPTCPGCFFVRRANSTYAAGFYVCTEDNGSNLWVTNPSKDALKVIGGLSWPVGWANTTGDHVGYFDNADETLGLSWDWSPYKILYKANDTTFVWKGRVMLEPDVTILGSGAGSDTPSNSNIVLLGHGAQATANNQVVLGNSSIEEVKTAGYYNAPGYKLNDDSLYLDHLVLQPSDSGKIAKNMGNSVQWVEEHPFDSIQVNNTWVKNKESIAVGPFDSIQVNGVWIKNKESIAVGPFDSIQVNGVWVKNKESITIDTCSWDNRILTVSPPSVYKWPNNTPYLYTEKPIAVGGNILYDDIASLHGTVAMGGLHVSSLFNPDYSLGASMNFNVGGSVALEINVPQVTGMKGIDLSSSSEQPLLTLRSTLSNNLIYGQYGNFIVDTGGNITTVGKVDCDSLQVGTGTTITRSGSMASYDFWTGTQAEWNANTPKNGVYPQASTTFWTIKD